MSFRWVEPRLSKTVSELKNHFRFSICVSFSLCSNLFHLKTGRFLYIIWNLILTNFTNHPPNWSSLLLLQSNKVPTRRKKLKIYNFTFTETSNNTTQEEKPENVMNLERVTKWKFQFRSVGHSLYELYRILIQVE